MAIPILSSGWVRTCPTEVVLKRSTSAGQIYSWTLIFPCTHHPPSPVLRCSKCSSDSQTKALRTTTALPFPGTSSLTFTDTQEDGGFLPTSTFTKALTVPGPGGWGETLLYPLQRQSTHSGANSSPQALDSCGFSTEWSKLYSQPRFLCPNEP